VSLRGLWAREFHVEPFFKVRVEQFLLFGREGADARAVMLALNNNLYGISPAEELHLGGRIDIQVAINGFIAYGLKQYRHSITVQAINAPDPRVAWWTYRTAAEAQSAVQRARLPLRLLLHL